MEATLVRNKNKNKTKIEYWDLNVYCPEQWYGDETYWDHDLWVINARVWQPEEEGEILDTDYTITLLEKEARAIGLVEWAEYTEKPVRGKITDLDGWLDGGLDGWIDLNSFLDLYKDRLSDRVLEFLEKLPVYMEDLDPRMLYTYTKI